MGSAYPCVAVKMERANVSHSPWEKCIYSLAKKVQGKRWKTFLWNNHLEREFQIFYIFICLCSWEEEEGSKTEMYLYNKTEKNT